MFSETTQQHLDALAADDAMMFTAKEVITLARVEAWMERHAFPSLAAANLDAIQSAVREYVREARDI